MNGLCIAVRGNPAPQGSKRAFAVRGKGGVPTGRVAVIESSHDKVKTWRQAVIDAADAARPGHCEPLAGPLVVYMTFWLRRPKGHFGTGRNAGRPRPSAPPVPAGTPDLSKLVRATEDALSDAGVWGDDAQVVECHAAKHWPPGPVPGAVIRIYRWQAVARDRELFAGEEDA